MADQYKVVYDLAYGARFNDLERPLPLVSRSRHSLTLNSFNEILIMTYTPSSTVSFWLTLMA